MRNFVFSANSLISWVFKFFIFAVVIYFFATGSFIFGGFALLNLAISLIPAFVNRSYDVNLPWSLDFLLTVWLTFSILGELKLYAEIWWWDNFLHFAGTAVFVYLAFVLVYALNFTKKIRLSIPLIGFSTFLVGVAFGAIWEIAEFYVWRITGNDTLAMGVPPDFELGLLDTFSDLRFNAIASVLVALAGMKYVANRRHVKLREWMRPFTKIFGEKIEVVRKKTRRKNKTPPQK